MFGTSGKSKRKQGALNPLSIFVCPDCGFKDSSIWRACSWLKYGVYTSFDEFQVFFPELAKQLAEIKATVPKGKARLENGSYVYRLTRNNFVYRMTKEIACEYSSHGFTEHPKDPFQKKLLEIQK